MKKFWKKYRVWIIILAVIALLVAVSVMSNSSDPHAGHDHGTGTSQNTGSDSHAGHNHSDYDIGKSYTVTQGQDGTYSVSVTTPHNEKLLVCDGLTVKPSCAKLSNSVLMVGNTANKDVSARWAVFCDGMNGKVSQRYDGCLATQGTTVVIGTNNGTAVEVKDALSGTVYGKVALPNASAAAGSAVIQSTAWADNGDLVVTYLAGETTKTYTIALPKK